MKAIIRILTVLSCLALSLAQDENSTVPIDPSQNNTTPVQNTTEPSNTSNATQNTTTPIQYGSSCLVDSAFCLNGALCGINGNCICPRYYFGSQCETTIAKDKRAQIKDLGMSSSGVFLICFFFLVFFPFLLYLVHHSLIYCCRPGIDDDSYCEMLKSALCCFNFECLERQIKRGNADNEANSEAAPPVAE
ncbi:hypothetical protein FGO68_gene17631 [Halteria grandinella]|uniref:EGF-like domain-containing protein n=1 Tax=Halteria grandinella TaxID=5974 RepID=A0A8J8NNG8_HALGN|nr:hypothetical protein FGO68_gene17631 [Halteria grandinella]